MITETPEVEEALAPLRERGVKIDFRRLLVLGAHAQMDQIEQDDEDVAEQKARQTAAMKRIRELVDVDVLLSDEAWR
jgi:HEAT repeat protein